MKKIIHKLANKAICAAFVILGAMSACAEVITNKLYDAVNTDVEVGYEIKGLADGRETAVVFTKDSYDISWTVPATLENVQFLVVGGGGGGGSGGDPASSDYYGVAGGGGGGVVTGSIFSLAKNWNVSVIVGKGGDGGIAKGTSIDEVFSETTVVAENGGDSKFLVNEMLYVKAPGGGGANKKTGGQGGSNSGSRTTSIAAWNPSLFETNSTYITASIFGNPGGMANSTAPASAGGGGGALEAGHDGVSSPSRKAGNGGAGLTNSITGVEVVYGSGGGGGQSYYQGTRNQGFGGAGAGDGGRCGNEKTYNDKGHIVASSASPNQGGGGGGGFRRSRDSAKTYIISNGGNGGSGIVVFRYAEPQTAVAQIGEQTYTTLEAAFAAATEGQTITLLMDATPALTSQRAITKAAVIDLNGKTLTLTEDDLYFGTTTFKNGTIVVDPSVKPSTAVFWMFANQTLTFDNVKVVATGVTGTYLIGLDGNNSDLNLINGSEILVENTTALDLDIICVNASTGNDIVIDNSKINVTNLDGRVLFRGNYTIKGTSEINLAGITKAGIRIEAGQTLSIEDTAKVTIAGELRDGGIHLTDVTATYTKADTATVTATINKPYQLSGEGTEASPYLIQNTDDLIFFRDSVNAGETKYSAPGVWVALAADIDMAGQNWVGIGSITQDHGFMGNFDGKTFKIKNLTINNPTLNGGYAYAGFFSITEGTETAQNIIKNLTIENVTINTTGQIVSAAIAYPYYTIVENVNVCGNISIKGGDYTAGALAYTRRCVNASNVSVVGNAGSTITGGQAVGGVISDIQMNGGLIANYSNFKAENLTITGTKMVGGISGIIATQTLNGATVKDVTINCADRAGQVAGSFGGTCTISNIVVENVTGADAVIGGGYDGSKPVEAKLGDTFYSTFAEAYSKATAGDTITLLRDVTLTSKLTLNKAVTIDGNGHSIVADSNIQWYTVSGKLNIKNYSPWVIVTAQGSELKNVVIDCNSCAGGVKIENADDVIFDTVSIINSKADTLTVVGSLVIEKYFKAEGSSSTIDARNGVVTVAEDTIFDMDKFSGSVSPAKCDLKAAVDTNGKPYFCAYGSTTYYRTLTSIVGTITDLTLLDDVSLNKDITVKGTLDLNGKTLTLAEGKVLKTGGNLTITGGAFANPILLTSASYTVTAPDGLNVITNVGGKKVVYENGVYKLVDIVYAAQIDEQKYETLQDALDAADGKTIVMLSDVVLENTVTIPAGKMVTLDLNGKTVSMVYAQNATANHEMIHNYGNLTIQDTVGGGKISYQYTGASLGTTYAANTISTEPGSVLTVKSGTIENLTYDSAVIAYAIDGRTNGGAGDVTVNIEGGTITSLRQSVRIFANSTTNTGTLNISGGEITGRVIVQNSNTNANKAALNITGGTFNANSYKSDVLYVGGSNSATIDINASISGGTFNGEITETNVEGFISGGTFNSKPKAEYCAEGFTPAKVDGGYSVGVLPDAEVTNLGAITVGPGGYTADMYKSYDLINGGSLVDAIVPYDLTLAMDFKAKDTAEQAAANKFGGYTTDFFIKMEDMSEGSFVGDGCYLAGYYPSFKAWVKIPLDGFTVENGKVYPVITSAGFDFKYTEICSTVGQFICGIYLTPEVLAANPNLTVDLTLGLAENKDAALNAEFVKVDNYVYNVDNLVTLPEVEITDIKSTLTDADPDLTFALNFAIKDADKLSKEYLEKLFAKYGDYYTDYVLTISGLTDPNGSVKFNANGNGDGYLAGQYDAWSKSWVTVPFSDVTVTNGQSFYIMEYAAQLMGKEGLRFTLAEVAEIVQNFDCGVYFTPDFLAANPDLKVNLELKVFTEDANGNKVNDITVAKNEFTKANFGVAAVVAEGKQTQYFTSLAEAIAAADGKTVRLLSDVELTDGIVIETGKNVTIDLAGFDITRTVGDVTANTQVFLNNGTLTITDSADEDGEISLTYTGDRNGNVTISTIRNYGVLNVVGGTVNCNSGNQAISYAIDAFSPGTVNISGGKVTGGASGYCIRMFLASTTSPVTLNVTGGEVGYVWAQQTNENANKGVINVEGGKVDYVYIDKTGSTICDASNVSVSIKTDATTYEPHIGEKGHIAIVGDYYKTIAAIALDIRIVDNKPQIGYVGNGILVLEAAVNLTGEWTKNISHTAVENDGDDAKTWVTPAEGYYFFKGFITK